MPRVDRTVEFEHELKALNSIVEWTKFYHSARSVTQRTNANVLSPVIYTSVNGF